MEQQAEAGSVSWGDLGQSGGGGGTRYGEGCEGEEGQEAQEGDDEEPVDIQAMPLAERLSLLANVGTQPQQGGTGGVGGGGGGGSGGGAPPVDRLAVLSHLLASSASIGAGLGTEVSDRFSVRRPLNLPPISSMEATQLTSIKEETEQRHRDAEAREKAKFDRFNINVVDMVSTLESNAAKAALEAAAAAAKAAQREAKENKPYTLPVIVVLKSLSLIELRRVHTMASNSPSVSAVCGQWAAATEVRDTQLG